MGIEKYRKELDDLRTKGTDKGLFPGYDVLEERVTFRLGYPVWIAGSPYSGKTELLMQLMLNLSTLYGFKGVIYLGETGEPQDIIAELCWKYMGKPYKKRISEHEENRFAMSEDDRFRAELFIDEHFVILSDLDFKDGFTMTNFYKKVKEVEKEKGKIHFTAIDPVNYLSKTDFDNKRDDIYLEQALRHSINEGKENKRINFLVNHVTKIQTIFDKDSKQRYTPPALPNEWANGQVWHRMAYQMLYCYRPPLFLLDSNNQPIYEENQSIIINQKAKPKGISKLGESSIFWDWKTNRYYEKDARGEMVFAHEQPKVIKLPVQDKLPF